MKRKQDLKRHPVAVRYDADDAEHRALVELAARTDRPIAWHVGRAIREYLQRAEEVQA